MEIEMMKLINSNNVVIPMEIEVMSVVVIEFGLKIENIFVLDENFGKKLKYPQLECTKLTYKNVSCTYKSIGGHRADRLKALEVFGIFYYLQPRREGS